MGAHLDARRRNIARAGRTMTLQRTSGTFPSVTSVTVELLGFSRAYKPDPLAGTLIQAELVFEILNDEIEASGSYTGPPVKGDQILADGLTYEVVGVDIVREASVIIGHSLMVKGGS